MSVRFFFLPLLLLSFSLVAKGGHEKIQYPLQNDPIDVVIVSHPKDKGTIGECINGIRENCNNIRRVIVVSPEKLTDDAEWFDEKKFPFTKNQIEMTIVHGSKKTAERFFNPKYHRGPGWYFQQLLKLYSPFVIPEISSNVLIIDADTIFMNPVEFLNESFGGFFCFDKKNPAKQPYFDHAKRLVPGYQRIHTDIYSVCHHILFQKPILEDLFHTVEEHHNKPFWKAFCHCVDLRHNKGASEYELYFNFALTHTDQVALRELKWANSSRVNEKEKFKKRGYVFVSFHDYLRKSPLTRALQGVGAVTN